MIKTIKTRKLNKALFLLEEAFNSNLEAHKKSLLSQEAYHMGDYIMAGCHSYGKKAFYDKKAQKIKEVISLIKEFNLPIKYGFGKDDYKKSIIYFSYNGEQVSFHSFDSFRGIKKYNGNWKGIKNEKFPIIIT